MAKKKPKPACEKDGKRREGQLVASLWPSCPSLVLSAFEKCVQRDEAKKSGSTGGRLLWRPNPRVVTYTAGRLISGRITLMLASTLIMMHVCATGSVSRSGSGRDHIGHTRIRGVGGRRRRGRGGSRGRRGGRGVARR